MSIKSIIATFSIVHIRLTIINNYKNNNIYKIKINWLFNNNFLLIKIFLIKIIVFLVIYNL